MITRLFRSPLHEHADPAQRVLGVAELEPASEDLARLLADPAPEVRVAVALRCVSLPALVAAWNAEADPGVRAALEGALGRLVAETADETAAKALLEAHNCTDRIRADVAGHATEASRRLAAIASIHDEGVLVDLALSAGQAEARLAAAEGVQSPEGLRKLADAANGRDRGVTRLATKRLGAMKDRATQETEADVILAQLEQLAGTPGPVLTAVVELNRRWQALDMDHDEARLARSDAARAALHARFDREQAEQLARARFDRRVREWSAALASPTLAEGIFTQKAELAALREEAQAASDATALAILDGAEKRILQWEQDHQAFAGAEALVVEAERLAADTSIDDASLPVRWQALDRAIRTPDLTRRFEAALIIVEQRRLAQIAVAEQEANAARQKVHALLHAAEEALAAGQTQAARAAADAIKLLKPESGTLPKPTHQRISRVVQSLSDLERWEAFGQHDARVRLCERAEAAPTQGLDHPKLAQEVKKLRDEWKELDRQHAGVPKSLWERFDGACEKAYAPAARYFAEQAAQRKAARQSREDFIATVATNATTLLAAEGRDHKAIERWLRETDRQWREGGLGSVDPGAWKKLDAKLKEALGPVRHVLGAARDEAKSGRQALIAEVTAIAEKAMDREAPSKVKAIQARWTEVSRAHPLTQRDERVLWEQFRAACDAVFEARHAKRKEDDSKKSEGRHALDELVSRMDRLAKATDRAENDLRKEARELEEQWRKLAGRPDPSMRGVESRFRAAKSSVEAVLTAKAREREAAVWQVLDTKERLCEELDAKVLSGAAADESGAALQENWAALPALPPAWEKKMLARRDAALRALADAGASGEYKSRIAKGGETRVQGLLELEMALGLDVPPEFQAQRLALQVNRLRERFGSSASTGSDTPGERLVAWCAAPGVADSRDRGRIERVIARMGPAR